MYFIHNKYGDDRDIKQFATIDGAMAYIHQYMSERELDYNDAIRFFTIIKGEKIEMGIKEVEKTVIVKELFVTEQKE